ncbi:MAG TPA: ABC transporter ATP-binding protein [Candidatus Nanoarchaeia archaeon]|nr:ABC transporter ATP-binding protein [Candidatus Nanoarchaeia archaeon]
MAAHPSSGIAISIKNLHKAYGSLIAVDGISFDVHEGELFGFLGPNGAGKTTTINILTGLATPTVGSVKIYGNDVVKDYREARALIGLAPQEYNFDVFITPMQCLRIVGGYYGMEKRALERRSKELLSLLGLWSKRDARIKDLSGGMKRCLTIARALIHDPKIIILDEPTAGVDVELRRRLWKLFTDLKRQGKTVILTTHYIEEAERLCDHIAVMNKGMVVAIDNKQQLINSFAKYTISVTVRKAVKKLPKSFSVYDYKKDGAKLFVFIEHKRKLMDILDAFRKARILIEDISVNKDNLEDIFVELTK